jgi:hypothetical protein
MATDPQQERFVEGQRAIDQGTPVVQNVEPITDEEARPILRIVGLVIVALLVALIIWYIVERGE